LQSAEFAGHRAQSQNLWTAQAELDRSNTLDESNRTTNTLFNHSTNNFSPFQDHSQSAAQLEISLDCDKA